MGSKLLLSHSPFAIVLGFLIFVRCGNGQKLPEKESTVIQTTWHLKILNDKPVSSDSVNLCFVTGSNKISGFTGCNRLTGSYFIEPGKVEISPAAATRIICSDEETIEKEF
ncbi:MAG: META domain-containing protein [Bacteroidota bacterium]|nr:META domain-containing protein [Bacteroidota bacterium]